MKTKNLQLSFFITVLLLVSNYTIAQTNLWGVTSQGGANHQGSIVKMNMDGSGLTKVYDFIDSTGSFPAGNLLQAKNGKLYGICIEGGDSESCVTYSFNPETGEYTDLYDFGFTGGDEPESGLVEGPDGNLYGVGSGGGIYQSGVIYRINIKDDSYTKLYDFDFIQGEFPVGSLFLASDGKFYGMTSAGGANAFQGGGVIYSYDLYTGVYTDLYEFNNVTEGEPFGGFIEPVKGKLYGTTSGLVDSIGLADPFSILPIKYGFGFKFDSSSLTRRGNIFSFDINTNSYTNLYNFDSIHGYHPYSTLKLASNGKLYGTAALGGAYNKGVLFSFDPQANVYTDEFDFNGTNGALPLSDLSESTDGNLYGTTYAGGTLDSGVIFKFNTADNSYATVFNFNGITGACPFTGSFATAQLITAVPTAPNENNDMSVYPVPAKQFVVVNISSPVNEQTVLTMSDIAGKTVLTQPFTTINSQLQAKIDITPLANGVYFLNAAVDGKVVTRKVVKE